MERSIFEYENDYILQTKEKIGDIPFLKFKPKDQNGILPSIIYYHGWASSKEHKIFESQIISSFGYQVIVPDALYHGERNLIDYDDPFSFNKYAWEIVGNTIIESKSFIDKIIKEHDADPDRICVMGSSMGSFSAGGLFVSNPKLKCLIAFNGGFSWNEFLEKRLKLYDEDYIKEFNPICNLDKLNNRAILMLHGKEDTSVPIECQRNFYNAAMSFYIDNPEKLKLIEFSGINHIISASMLQNAITFIKMFL